MEYDQGTTHELLLELLSKLGVAALSRYIGKEKTERFLKAGYSIDTGTLAEILLIENGVHIFKNPEIRIDVLLSYGRKYLVENLGLSEPLEASLKEYNNFKWGNNQACRNFLEIIGISGDQVFETSSTQISSEVVQVAKCLHPYQNWVRRGLVEFISDINKQRTIVHMPTGAGKTRTSLEAVCDYFRSTISPQFSVVWLAHSEELCEQAAESFIKLWERYGTEDVKVLRLWGGARLSNLTIDMPMFVVTSFQTAYNMVLTNDDDRFEQTAIIRSTCELLVVDEAHQSTAPTYKDVIELLSKKDTKIIGLTATPGRHHVGGTPEETEALSAFYQNNKINIVSDTGEPLENPIKYLTDKGVLARVEKYQIDSGSEVELSEVEQRHIRNYLDIPDSVLKRLGKDEKRTSMVAVNVMKLAIEKEFSTIVFAPSKDNAIELSTLLTLKGCKAAAVTSDTSQIDRRDMIERFKNGEIPVLVNFGVLTTGFDAPNIKAVVVARPTTSVVLYSQMIGRGLRGPMMGGEEECYLVDVVDNIVNMPDSDQAFTYFDEYYKN